MQYTVDGQGKLVLRLHYSADPEKAEGEHVFVPELDMRLSPWAYREYMGMTDKALYKQEYEIDGSATSGARIYHLEREATLEKRFPIPPDWTRYYVLDPHPGVPHFHLWGAVDPWGDLWIYREFWPSRIYGKPGKPPQDDAPAKIKQHVEIVHYLESDQNPQNYVVQEVNGERVEKRFNEEIDTRIIDYAARAFGKDQDNPDAENYQRRFERAGEEVAQEQNDPKFQMYFVDCKKGLESSYDTVNEWLTPRLVETATGDFKRKSRLHIFDDLAELIWELDNVRRRVLSAEQAERMDPTGLPLEVRKHGTDTLNYLCVHKPEYRRKRNPSSNWTPIIAGINH
jgi:hypothetical protein